MLRPALAIVPTSIEFGDGRVGDRLPWAIFWGCSRARHDPPHSQPASHGSKTPQQQPASATRWEWIRPGKCFRGCIVDRLGVQYIDRVSGPNLRDIPTVMRPEVAGVLGSPLAPRRNVQSLRTCSSCMTAKAR